MPQARFRLQLPPIRAICTFRSFAATRRKAGIRDAPRHMPKRFGGHPEHRRKQGTAEHLRLLRSPVSVERRRPRMDAAALPAPAARLTGRGSGRRRLSALWHEPARAAMRPCVEPSTSARLGDRGEAARFAAASAGLRPPERDRSGSTKPSATIGHACRRVSAGLPSANDCTGSGYSCNTRHAAGLRIDCCDCANIRYRLMRACQQRCWPLNRKIMAGSEPSHMAHGPISIQRRTHARTI